jgi:sugar/nucleoside kinase (ribokinase family)
MARTDVLFVDRVSRSALTLAESASKNGAVVFFEPSASSSPKQLAEMLELSHVVKYSHDRVKDTGELEWGANTHLQIQTFGRGGLQFRTNLRGRHRITWRSLPAVPVGNLRDAAGAGDWLSAVIINRLCQAGVKQLSRAKFEDLLETLHFGQRVAAWNCSFVGPRGSMYSLSRKEFWSRMKELQNGKPRSASAGTIGIPEMLELPQEICSLCSPKRIKVGGTFAA